MLKDMTKSVFHICFQYLFCKLDNSLWIENRIDCSPDNGAEEGVDPKIWSAEHLHQRNFLLCISARCLRLQLFVQLLPSSLHLQEGKLSHKNVVKSG